MTLRIDAIEPGAADGDRRAAGIETGRVCRTVDALGEAAGHDDAEPREVFREVARDADSAATGIATADHRDLRAPQGVEITLDEQQRWRVVESAQQGRVVGIGQRQHMTVGRGVEPIEVGADQRTSAAREFRANGLGQARRAQRATTGIERGMQAAEVFMQLGNTQIAEAGRA